MQVDDIAVEKHIDNPSTFRTGTQISLVIPQTISFHE